MNWNRHKLPALLMLMIVVYSCASMGNPDGGPYDEEPPSWKRLRRKWLYLLPSWNSLKSKPVEGK